MVTISQLRQGIGIGHVSKEATWPDDATALDESPQHFSSPARITITSVIGLAVVGLALTAIGVMVKSSGERTTLGQEEVTPSVLSEPIPAPPPPEPATVIVHVAGHVERAGIVELDDGARVVDAINAAGGVTSVADLESLNLARVVVDGEQVYVPERGEDVAARTPSSQPASSGPISLSRADQAALETLPGVGPALAARIIAFRDAYGPFQSVTDVLAVSGIGPATLDGFADQVIP